MLLNEDIKHHKKHITIPTLIYYQSMLHDLFIYRVK